MRTFSSVATIMFVLACGPPGPTKAPPGAGANVPPDLPGTWENEQFGMSLTFAPDGKFVWDQQDVHKEGWFVLDGSTLVMTVGKGFQSRYTLLGLVGSQLTLRDPAGTQVVLHKHSESPVEEPPASDVSIAGIWSNPTFQVRIELAEDGAFVWKQGSLVEAGGYELKGGSLLMSTGGHTSSYAILSLGAKKLVLLDPAGNELPLERVGTGAPSEVSPSMGKNSLLGGKPAIKIVSKKPPKAAPGVEAVLVVEPGDQVPPTTESVLGPGGIFYFVPPKSFKVDTQKVCGNKFTSHGKVYTCWNRNDLYSPDSSRFHFDIATFVTWAAPGALDALSPSIDSVIGSFDQDRTSVSDEIWEMSGFEVFSTSIAGSSNGSSKQMTGRIVGIHYGDLLIVCVLALSADPAALAQWGAEMSSTLDSMSFFVAPSEQTASSVTGSWKSDDGAILDLLADGTFSRDGKSGHWVALGRTLVLATGGPSDGEVEGFAVQVEGSALNLGGVFYDKQI